MRRRIVRSLIILAALFVAIPNAPLVGSSDTVIRETKETDVARKLRLEICAALSLESDAQQFQAIQIVLEGCRFEDAWSQKLAAFDYLSAIQRWLDLTPWNDVLMEVGDYGGGNLGRVLILRTTLFNSNREWRKAAYRNAIQAGTPKSPPGDGLQRLTAMRLAALDGIEDLLPEIQEQHGGLSTGEKRFVPLAWVEAHMELRKGAKNREEAAFLAVERVALMEDRVFLTRMEEDPAFRRAVIESARYVCEEDPFRGGYNAGCDIFADVLARQYELANGDWETLDKRTGRWFDTVSDVCEPAWPAWKKRNAGSPLITSSGPVAR
jgi:hypothetical protein